jgi:sortase (surface protein transpeptidase)
MTVLGVALLAYGGYRAFDPTSADSGGPVARNAPSSSLDAELPGSNPSAVTGTTEEGRGPTPKPPTSVEVPELGVVAPVGRLATDDSGELESVGWWVGGAMPGESGPAVLVGHRDSDTGPAVFYGLGELAAGDSVVVTDESDHSWRFRVTAVEQFDKDSFPTEKVYGPTKGSTLRLLTCAGGFDGDEYEDNLVVYATSVD